MDAYAAVFAGPQEAAKPGAAVGNGGGDRPRFVQAQKEIRVRGPLCGGRYTVPGDVSSQFISGLLLALPLAPGDSEIRTNVPLESRPYVSMTIDVMRRFGVEIRTENGVFSVPGGQRYRPAVYTVEADYSQAAFFLAAAALGRDLRCAGLDPNSAQGDRAILRILEEMGAAVLWQNGLVSVRADRLCALEIDVRDIPDLAPPLAALCCFCEGESRIVNAGRLRLKESDRLRALASELGALGADITEGTDSLTIRGRNTLPGGRANARNDHRIAMTVALAAIRCQSDVRLTGWRSVRKSYPDFWRTFGKEF
jgi:3-phosphoshikimate 1-carboxyvinyltransferase